MPQEIGKYKFSMKHKQAHIHGEAVNQIAYPDQNQRKLNVVVKKHPVKRTV